MGIFTATQKVSLCFINSDLFWLENTGFSMLYDRNEHFALYMMDFILTVPSQKGWFFDSPQVHQ
jgi:hypothetical protein